MEKQYTAPVVEDLGSVSEMTESPTGDGSVDLCEAGQWVEYDNYEDQMEEIRRWQNCN